MHKSRTCVDEQCIVVHFKRLCNAYIIYTHLYTPQIHLPFIICVSISYYRNLRVGLKEMTISVDS